MKFSYEYINRVFLCDGESVPTLVVENKPLFVKLITDIYSQTQGLKGKAVLAREENLLDFSKYAELITCFVPFDINRKTLINKILSALEYRAQGPDFYERTTILLNEIEKYADELALDFPCDLDYNKLSISTVLKSIGVEVHDDSTSLTERLINYMELVREFDRERLFITAGLRGYVGDSEIARFVKTVKGHKFNLLMIESVTYPFFEGEDRYTVDEDLCEF